MTRTRLANAVLAACLVAAAIGVDGWHQAVIVAACLYTLATTWPDLTHDQPDWSPTRTALEELKR
jgi:hypothetical protein